MTLSNTNYNLTLVAWLAQAPSIQDDVSISFGVSEVDTSSGGENGVIAKAAFISTYNWIIIDGLTP